MSITIIKGGKNEFVGHCKWCGCEFRYTIDSIGADDNIGCPFCSRRLRHLGENGTSEVARMIPGWAYGYGNANYEESKLSAQMQMECEKFARGNKT